MFGNSETTVSNTDVFDIAYRHLNQELLTSDVIISLQFVMSKVMVTETVLL